MKIRLLSICCIATLAYTVSSYASELSELQSLGKNLFFDQNLSINRNQSCASCHHPDKAFTDPRSLNAASAGSIGSNNTSIGDRNTPSAAYASFTPEFHINDSGQYIGGLFWDGRANNLKEQAAGPPLNPDEMGLRSDAEFSQRIRENQNYLSAFSKLFGEQVVKENGKLFDAAITAIANYETSTELSPFDSKYDRYLRGEYQMTAEEDLGMTLFFSQQFTNCNQCHQLHTSNIAAQETFTDYTHHNIGVPSNIALRKINGTPPRSQDFGLGSTDKINTENRAKLNGKFKVPTLRNVAITAPYMHNGVFNELETVVRFYNKYNSRSSKNQTNPETNQRWLDAEVSENISLKELEHGPALDTRRIKALVAFMKTLTDKKYEHLIK